MPAFCPMLLITYYAGIIGRSLQAGDIISTVSVSSEDPEDSVPGPVTYILSFYNKSRFWCSNREILPASATFYFVEEVLLTSVAYHGFDGENDDDYVTQYSWEYSVANSSFQTYTDLGNNTVSYFTMYCKTTKLEQEKSFTVYCISSKCRKNFCGVCFICIESAAIAQSIHWKNFCDSSKICENHETFL